MASTAQHDMLSLRGLRDGSCALAVLLFCAAHAVRADEARLEEVVVTGSRLQRIAVDSPSPILLIDEAAFDENPATSVEGTLNEFPQFTPTASGTSLDPGNDGQATVSLRGLGPTRTLVLVDGRRLMPSDGQGQVDLNVLPPQLIESVEVVTGGASAVYGSDAIAGVVNFRLREEFEGLELSGQWSQTGHGDGEEYSVGLTMGRRLAEGRGSITAYLGYSDRRQLDQEDRAFSRVPLFYYPDETDGVGPGHHFLAQGDTVTPDGLFITFATPTAFNTLFESYGYPAGTVPYIPAAVLNADGTVFAPGFGGVLAVPGGVANYRGEPDPVLTYERAYTYNYAADTALLLPLERFTGFVNGRYRLSDSAELHGQLLYADYSATRELSPTPANVGLIPVTNPYITPDLKFLLDSRPDPSLPFRFLKRTMAVGPRIADNDRQLLQGTVGLRGRVRDWDYDVYVQAGRNERAEHQSGNVSLSRMQDLTFAADGGVAICGGFNPFDPVIREDCAKYIAVDASNAIVVKQLLGEASITGELLDLPAGALRVAAGIFYKHDDFSYDADPALTRSLPGVPNVIGPRPDISGFPAGADRSGSNSNTDLYVETSLPLLDGRPGVKALTLGLGYRWSDYEQAGSQDTYKAELVYRPVDPLRLRGSYQRAVRAPSIEELYYPELAAEFYLQAPDPCDYQSPERRGPDRAQVEALCLAQGMPPQLLPTFTYKLFRVKGITGGNPDLEPEQADTYTLGLVLTSPSARPALAGLQLSLDWYWIDLEDAIGRWDSNSAIHRCFDRTFNPDYEPGNVYCSFFERVPESGEIFARLIDRNIGGLETAGLDLQLRWQLDAGPGRVTTDAFLTYVDYWRVRDPGGSTREQAGTIGGEVLGTAVPELKSQLRLGYEWGPAQVYARWRYIDEMRDFEYPAFVVPHRDYFDVGASYAFGSGSLQGLTLRAGVENLLDEEPPIYPSYQQANTEPALYDVLGQRFYLSAAWHF